MAAFCKTAILEVTKVKFYAIKVISQYCIAHP